jgi:hypothetical protein
MNGMKGDYKMKLRNGFVSNSSSSSFIVGFDKNNLPKNAYELQVLLWGDNDSASVYHNEAPTSRLAKIVWQDYQEQLKTPIKTIHQFVKEIKEGYFDGYPDLTESYPTELDKLRKKFRDTHGFDLYSVDIKNMTPIQKRDAMRYHDAQESHWETERRIVDEAAMEYAKKEWSKFSGKLVLVFSYADEDGSTGSILEHGGTFDNLTHVVISHH